MPPRQDRPGNAGLQSGIFFKFFHSSVPSVFSVRTLLFLFEPPVRTLFEMHIAPSREEGALTPRCMFSPCSLCPPCEIFFRTLENSPF